MIGLQESYLRTIPKDRYPYLEKNVLLYFSYSNSLSSRERAYLYANLVKNRRKYEAVFPSFEPQIEEMCIRDRDIAAALFVNLYIQRLNGIHPADLIRNLFRSQHRRFFCPDTCLLYTSRCV